MANRNRPTHKSDEEGAEKCACVKCEGYGRRSRVSKRAAHEWIFLCVMANFVFLGKLTTSGTQNQRNVENKDPRI